jgi:flavodoxin
MEKYQQRGKLLLSRRDMLKKTALGLLAAAAAPVLFSVSSSNAATRTGGNNILTVFYSRTGNTRSMARKIHALVGGDIVELETVRPYPEGHQPTVEQAKKELAANFYPPLKVTVKDISSYDIILVGSPCWWYTFASPVRGFLAQHNFSGKRLSPFITHKGAGVGKSIDDMKSLCPGAIILEGLAVRGNRVDQAQTEMIRWLKCIGLYQ